MKIFTKIWISIHYNDFITPNVHPAKIPGEVITFCLMRANVNDWRTVRSVFAKHLYGKVLADGGGHQERAL